MQRHSLTILAVLGLVLEMIWLGSCAATGAHEAVRREVASVKHSVVVSYHPIATEIGERVLSTGGNAFDAFVAVTAAQYVLSEGVTSLAGPLGALMYDSKTSQTIYLDAGFNGVVDPTGQWNASNPKNGATAKVPGAPMGLEAIVKRFGQKSFREDLQPAIDLARRGYPATSLLLREMMFAKDVLNRSEYGKATYFPGGNSLKEGDTLKLNQVANTIESLANEGSLYFYTGAWAKEAIRTIQSQGGRITQKDFDNYQIQWRKPLKISYRGYEVFGPSGRTYAGHSALLALKALERVRLDPNAGHFSKNANALEILAKIETEAENTTARYAFTDSAKQLDNQASIQSALDSDAEKVWVQATSTMPSSSSVSDQGTHSYHVVVIDNDGNAITGTNTIESLPWGSGIFVGGIALSSAGNMPYFDTQPGKRDLSPLSMEIGLKNSKVAFASGAFASSLTPASFQFMVNIIDYKLSAADVVSLPRFGINSYDMISHKPTGRGRWLDKRVDQAIVQALSKRGLPFDQEGYVDTGLGSAAIVNADGSVDGAIAPLISQKIPGFDN